MRGGLIRAHLDHFRSVGVGAKLGDERVHVRARLNLAGHVGRGVEYGNMHVLRAKAGVVRG